MTKPLCISIGTLLLSLSTVAQKSYPSMVVPGADAFAHIDTKGITILPSGRQVTPAGNTIRIAHDPFGLAVSPDKSRSVTLHNGVFTVINNRTLEHVQVGWVGDIPYADRKDEEKLAAYQATKRSPLSNGSFLGVAFGKDDHTVYLSGGDNGSVIVYDIDSFQRLDSISLNGNVNGEDYDDSFTSDLVYDARLDQLLVLDRGNFRMVRIDLATRKIVGSVKTGRQPFGLALSPDKKTAFVANVGMYDNPLLPDLTLQNYDSMLLPGHP